VTGIGVTRLPTDLFIGGQWGPAVSGKRLDVANPATSETIASVADAGVEEVATSW
jgi:succinate-semialdehyde dehydrogenase / glutarate-semialdehyde dehydrogenase